MDFIPDLNFNQTFIRYKIFSDRSLNRVFRLTMYDSAIRKVTNEQKEGIKFLLIASSIYILKRFFDIVL
ncbi:hypothetical protein DLM78_20015 [Leptospira stimsonii]|uniref:Uncharacterized protein n=1 Tax=Leptospira stimsonii TaxID=2202203 RepID=A0A8B3CNQ9_9LEPT|nr:hypothetical protein DLM78_20015 [Leptospira stimsonii]